MYWPCTGRGCWIATERLIQKEKEVAKESEGKRLRGEGTSDREREREKNETREKNGKSARGQDEWREWGWSRDRRGKRVAITGREERKRTCVNENKRMNVSDECNFGAVRNSERSSPSHLLSVSDRSRDKK